MPNPYTLPDSLLEAWLHEDCPAGDATTLALGIAGQAGQMRFQARQAMCVCGVEEAARMARLRGLRILQQPVRSGDWVEGGADLLSVEGEAGALHAVWKTAQTQMEYLSGLASVAYEMVQRARVVRADVGVVCTRKNFPGSKAASIKAILSGGATPHRLSLSETLLVFAEHRAFLGTEAPSETVRRLKRQWPERALVVELADQAAALVWAEAGADVIQLEKCTPAQVAEIRRGLPRTVKLAVAGGVNLDNVEDYVVAGADVLVSSAPYFAKPRDVAVTLQAVL